MKWTRFFLILFLLPTLSYASINEQQYLKIMNMMTAEWQRHSQLVEEAKHLGPNQDEHVIHRLTEAIACCRRALDHCNKILDKIADKSKHRRDKKPWPTRKKDREKDKDTFKTEINELQNAINNILKNSAFEKAFPLYQESLKKADLANSKNQNCSRGLNDPEEVVSILNEIAKIYDEAAALAHIAYELIASYPADENQNLFKEARATYQNAANQYKKEADEWPTIVLARKANLKEQLATLKKEARGFEENGLKRKAYKVQKKIVSVLEQLIEAGEGQAVEELAELQQCIAAFEAETFRARENERSEQFFKKDLLQNPKLFLHSLLHKQSRPLALPLDGQVIGEDKNCTLYAEQFYRFLVQSDTPILELIVTVYKKGEVLFEETIDLPTKNARFWEDYLIDDGMTFIPDTRFPTELGLDLRLSFFYDLRCNFSMIIAQKCSSPDYQFSFALTNQTSLYACNVLQPPPWQLSILQKPIQPNTERPIRKNILSIANDLQGQPVKQLEEQFPLLDQFVEQLKKDPLALTAYVHNEIALDIRSPFQVEGVFLAPEIQRNACMTFLEKRGSPWEQCQLLVYLLQKAGYQTFYATPTVCHLPKTFVEKMLFTKLPTEQTEGLLQYPSVLFFDGKEWISLFPWMKEMQVQEGRDLYNLMPEEYANADLWILRYLKEDENILKHVGPDGDDTLGVLFVRFVEETLRKQGLSLSDVGIHRTQVKKQFSSWLDFPRPLTQGNIDVFAVLDKNSPLFTKVQIEIFSHENPQKKISCRLPLVDLNCNAISLRFTPHGKKSHRFHALLIGEQEERLLDLDPSDRMIDIRVSHENFIESEIASSPKTISIEKGTEAALCFHLGGESSKLTSQFYEQFSSEKEETKRLHALLAFVGASYFEKCGRAEKILAELHKIPPLIDFAFGLAKLSPASRVKEESDIKAPQVDMIWYSSPLPIPPHATFWQQDIFSARRQLEALMIVDSSSNEHQILLDIFGVKEAVSTVKLLQLANREQQKQGRPEPGFLILTSSRIAAAENKPELAEVRYFSQLKYLHLNNIRASRQWDFTKNVLNQNAAFDAYAYAYMTPGPTSSENGTYKEMGTLVIHPLMQGGLISSNNLWLHGGLGAPLPEYYFTSSAMDWQLVLGDNGSYQLYVPPRNTPPPPSFSEQTPKLSSDVRSEHKSPSNIVSDPVDVVTGAFYIDEVDLVLPGSFPLEIRRNYNSQNPQLGDFGCGWKLSLNPFLIKQEEKLYAAEADGTVIVYSYNPKTSRWEVFPKDNLDLCNFNQKGIGSSANPFHAYIENEILYGSDGSKRVFKKGLLRQWINNKGNTLTFSYSKDKLSRIESSNGDFCDLHYNHEGKISEIYARDGRRISYNYNSQADLIKVTLPNTAVITYEYDSSHRIIRETKPDGKVLENTYKDGKVKEQRSPMGLAQAMIRTATFDYQDGMTTVTDAKGGKTTYKIFQKQIYKITDPLSYQTLQSWFIDEHSWFDPVTECVVKEDLPGGALRSLKETTDKRGLTTSYLYDSRGNLQEIALKGSDLTGSKESLIAKKLTYNEQNLCVQEEVLEQKTITTYDLIFPYLPERIEKYSDNTLLSYIDLEYNSLGQITREDLSGAVTLYKYDSRGFPRQKIQITATDDPDVVTTYSYNHQGQCIQIISAEGIQENDYDIMGNAIQSQVFSPSGSLLSATYVNYNLSSEPICTQTANPDNILYLDYHASGRIKASRQILDSHGTVAYTLYEYDPRGYLIQEVDPLGYTIYRDHDALGNITCETKEGDSTHFTYEPGGLVESITSPSKAKTTRLYTTNGLLKEELYPDGTRSSIVYDFFGRPIRETKNEMTWEIEYDDAHQRVIRTHTATSTSEIQEFDARGNLIRFTDPAGYTSEKTYDGLNRLKTEVSPSGEQTIWNYKKNTIICTLPSGEKKIERYEGGRVTESRMVDAQEHLITLSSYHYDPETDVQKIIHGGGAVTTTWMNTLGLPLKVQKGNITTTYTYDFLGNCTTMTDGDGRTTHQTFDGLRRIIEKKLPDASVIKYTYDSDSNLTEYHLPNDTIWKASYDSMGRKTEEELQAGKQSSQRWEYTYENGYLKEAKDPLQRLHTYVYDPEGRLSQETVDNWQHIYTYDPRGILSSAEQIGDKEQSQVERSYDADGRLILETIYLNSNLIQQTHQTWEPTSRSLQIDNHTRHFIYRNNQLTKVSTKDIDLSYTYHLSGSLKNKSTPLSTTDFNYNAARLPESIYTRFRDGWYPESLDWTSSGKLSAYSSSLHQKQFAYTTRGYLQSAGEEKYVFDFGAPGIGTRTTAPISSVPQDGLDAFGKILTEFSYKGPQETSYNLMGEVTAQNQRQFAWDPWGRLLQVSDETFTWEASYDAFGRRLQTRYTPTQHETLTRTSLYDPEEEFQEIGIKYRDKTFWKIYGPNSCDAVTDETGASVVLLYNALDQLAGVISQKGIVYNQQLPSSYGPQLAPPYTPSDLLSFAQSLTWHSQAQDPTGLIWMGARYYDPQGGRFLSPDPVGYPICLDLYAYAGGDPVNYMDPDGRLWSAVYQPVKPTFLYVKDVVSKTWHNPQVQGAVQVGYGTFDVVKGVTHTVATRGAGFVPGGLMILRGADDICTGIRQIISNEYVETGTSQVLQALGVPHDVAERLTALSRSGSPKNAPQVKPSLVRTSLGKSAQHTKSNLRRGQQVHKSYKATIADELNLRKEYRLPSGRRIDFIDITNGKVYELKPNNPRAIREGIKQLEQYIKELKEHTRLKHINWEGILETY